MLDHFTAKAYESEHVGFDGLGYVIASCSYFAPTKLAHMCGCMLFIGSSSKHVMGRLLFGVSTTTTSINHRKFITHC